MKKSLLHSLIVFMCLIAMVQYSMADELSVSLTPVYGPYWVRTLPWTSEEQIAVQCDISDMEANERNEYVYETTIKTLRDDEVVALRSLQGQWSSSNLSTVFTLGPLVSGNYSLQVSIVDKNSGKTDTGEVFFEIGNKKFFRLLSISFVDLMARHPLPPVCLTGQPVSIVCECSSIVQVDDDVSITVFDKESLEILTTYNVEAPRNPFFVSFQLNNPGKHILLIKAVNKTKNLEVEYELPVVVVDRDELIK